MGSKIPIAGPSITELEKQYVAEAVEHGWYEHHSDFIRRFESSFAAYVGRRFAVSTPSCTSAIHLALAAMGIGDEDEVIVPESTWIATAAPIHYVGARPVFADIDETWCLSPESVKAHLGRQTKAVIAVDLYGGMPHYDALVEICDAAGISLIEDAAQAIGSHLVQGDGTIRRAGSFGAVSTFSFHGSKTLATGEGGMLVTDDATIYERVLVLRDHGRTPGDTTFFNQEVAFKYRMSNLQAALGLAQLERIETLVGKKKATLKHYRDGLSDLPLAYNPERDGLHLSPWMSTIIPDAGLGWTKQRLGAELAKHGIDTRPFFHPLSSLPAYRGHAQHATAPTSHGTAYRLGAAGLNLPSAAQLEPSQLTRVCEAVRSILVK